MKKYILILVLFVMGFTAFAGSNDKSLEYYANGSIKSKVIKHEDGFELTKYYESGKVQEIEFFDLNKNRTGNWTNYYEDGTKMGEASFKDDKKNGKWKTYNTDGKLIVFIKYNKGKKEVICTINEKNELAVK